MPKCFSRLAVFVVLGFCAATASAEDEYQTEIAAYYFRHDSSSDFRSTSMAAFAEIFFAPVKTADHPYAEAAFLERTGSVHVIAADNRMRQGGAAAGDGRVLGAGVNYATPDSSLAARVTYTKTRYSYDAPFNVAYKGNDYSVRVGNYFTDTLLGGVSYANSKMEESNFGWSYKTRDYGLFAHYLNELGQGNALSFDGSLTRSTNDNGTRKLTNTNEHVSLDYYFSRGMSAGLGISNSTGDDQSNERRDYSANVRYFITPRFSLFAGYTKTLSANASGYDGKAFSAGMALRF